ncbi:MAG: S-formylglutathione hydrolase [Gammaproteobacteria bacterium]|nr:MAG: S-formylglutathione hydrolase [Gammaproteobacteria bacterium]UTW43185.1 S-formylglutathione hydrolase [bacterium SCSIO 12844]
MINLVSSTQCFNGVHQQYTHQSDVLNCQMRFAVFLPPQYNREDVPLLYWLSGLTCTDENFMQKAGALKYASELGLAIVAADTSPRGEGVPDDKDNAYDFGLGAGFYLNATKEPWRENYQMYDYILKELPSVIEHNFKFSGKPAISGHSMGGHGALVLALRTPQKFASVSAFSPICHPSVVPWGKKAFSNYLGDDKNLWAKYDSVLLMQNITALDGMPNILIDQGDCDQFLESQLAPESLEKAAKKINYPLTMRYQKGYDHSYYFISTFIADHLKYHYLNLVK